MNGVEQGHVLEGRYRLISIIGRGGMGSVWRARDESLGRDVAVKEIVWPPSFSEAEREAARSRALREAQTAARLHNPNIVRIYDIVDADDRPWIVMELLPYQSLRDILREGGPLPPARAARLGLGILAALRAAHAEGIVHRDVKPANILVGPEDRAVLTDFGIARAADSPTLTGSGLLIGSPSYIAPERARGMGAGPAGDLWGLGACLYAAVEGRAPFEHHDALASLTAVVADEPDPAVHAGPLLPVINGLLRKDPDERLSADDAEGMLAQAAGGSAARPGWREARGRGSTDAAVPLSALPAPAPATRVPAAEVRAFGDAPASFDVPVRESPVPPPRRPAGRLGAVAAVIAVAVIAATAVAAGLRLTGGPGHKAAAPTSPGSTSRASASPSPRSSSPASPSLASPSASPASPSGPGNPGKRKGPGNRGKGDGNHGKGTEGLPVGYYRFVNSTGFSIGVPQGWQVSHSGHYVYVQDPASSGTYLLIDQSDQPRPDPLADWQQQEANRASGYPDYHRIRLEPVSYPQAEKAADWEFTYLRNGVLVHILNRNVLANSHHAYALYWSAPQSDWAADYHYFQAFAATFRPAPP